MTIVIRILISALGLALGLPIYLRWANALAEQQIDKMQEAAFNTPGVESPLTPGVLGGGAALVGGHLLLGRLLGLRVWQALISLLLGAAAGIILFVNWPWEDAP